MLRPYSSPLWISLGISITWSTMVRVRLGMALQLLLVHTRQWGKLQLRYERPVCAHTTKPRCWLVGCYYEYTVLHKRNRHASSLSTLPNTERRASRTKHLPPCPQLYPPAIVLQRRPGIVNSNQPTFTMAPKRNAAAPPPPSSIPPSVATPAHGQTSASSQPIKSTKTSAKSTPRNSQNAQDVLLGVWDRYVQQTPQRVKLIDVFMAFLIVVGVLQFVYCVIAGNYVCFSPPSSCPLASCCLLPPVR